MTGSSIRECGDCRCIHRGWMQQVEDPSTDKGRRHVWSQLYYPKMWQSWSCLFPSQRFEWDWWPMERSLNKCSPQEWIILFVKEICCLRPKRGQDIDLEQTEWKRSLNKCSLQEWLNLVTFAWGHTGVVSNKIKHSYKVKVPYGKEVTLRVYFYLVIWFISYFI